MDDRKFANLVDHFIEELDLIWEEYKKAVLEERQRLLDRYYETSFEDEDYIPE